MTKWFLILLLAAAHFIICGATARAQNRPWLGICFDGRLSQAAPIAVRAWSAVGPVRSIHGPAVKAGILVGDSIALLDGQRVIDLHDLFCKFAKKRPGDVVNLVVLRNGQSLTVSAT